MNKRIKELEEQAWSEVSLSGAVLWSDWRDKFAARIIDLLATIGLLTYFGKD